MTPTRLLASACPATPLPSRVAFPDARDKPMAGVGRTDDSPLTTTLAGTLCMDVD